MIRKLTFVSKKERTFLFCIFGSNSGFLTWTCIVMWCVCVQVVIEGRSQNHQVVSLFYLPVKSFVFINFSSQSNALYSTRNHIINATFFAYILHTFKAHWWYHMYIVHIMCKYTYTSKWVSTINICIWFEKKGKRFYAPFWQVKAHIQLPCEVCAHASMLNEHSNNNQRNKVEKTQYTKKSKNLYMSCLE